jgi:hypothetical protein
MDYPKWITRAAGIGPVLVLNAAEEKQLLDAWDTEQLTKAEESAVAAKAEATAAQEAAQVVLKKQGK